MPEEVNEAGQDRRAWRSQQTPDGSARNGAAAVPVEVDTSAMGAVAKAALAITEAVESHGRIHLGTMEAISAALAAQRVFAPDQADEQV